MARRSLSGWTSSNVTTRRLRLLWDVKCPYAKSYTSWGRRGYSPLAYNSILLYTICPYVHYARYTRRGMRVESKTKLLDEMRDVLRLKHLSLRTEEAYISWVKRFMLFHEKRHPTDM